MTAAIFGLVGAVLGGLLSFGATYILARRKEKSLARASARLLQNELRAVSQRLYKVVSIYDVFKKPGPVAERYEVLPMEFYGAMGRLERDRLIPLPGLTDVSLTRWFNHQERLAEYLKVDDWYAVSEAYLALVRGQVLEKTDGRDGMIDIPYGKAFRNIREQVVAGANAISRLAGRVFTDEDLMGGWFDLNWESVKDIKPANTLEERDSRPSGLE